MGLYNLPSENLQDYLNRVNINSSNKIARGNMEFDEYIGKMINSKTNEKGRLIVDNNDPLIVVFRNQYPHTRILRPNSIITMEFNPKRLNIVVKEVESKLYIQKMYLG